VKVPPWSAAISIPPVGDTDFQRRHDRFVSAEAYRRLAEVRATWDPGGVFCSYLGGAAGELNRHA
jgi:hypothetical protein